MPAILKSRRGIIGISAAVVAVIVAIVVVVLLRRGDAYRTIQIYQLDGQAEVTRQSSRIDPYVNMMLESGDYVRTFEESYLYLKMDEDKYMLAEPQTRFTLTATGTPADSRTRIDLELGAVVNHITQPLSEKSSYEVTTPNSTMAVRGTSFRVYVWFDEEGISHTLLQVFEGVVEVHLIYPDGSQSEEARQFAAGQTASVWGSDVTSDYDYVEDEIDYFSLDIPVLEFLKIGIGHSVDREDYDITIPDVDEIIRLKQTYFDVTFTVDGRPFGTQSVLFDNRAHAPSLMPSERGHWDFDFDTAIRENNEISWVTE